jgi:histidinol-phosphate aminotransferase
MALTPQQLVRPEILSLKAYPVPDSAGMVKLDAMELPYRLPEGLRQALAARLAEAEINRYPEPTGRRLRERLAQRMAVPAGMQLLLGNGSDDLIQIVTLTLARPGAVMLIPEPTFVVYRMNANLSGMTLASVPLREDFSFDREAFVAKVRELRPSLIYLAYPNNPTGVLYPEDDVAAVIRAAEGLVVVDEAYHAYARASFLPRLAEFPNLVVMRTVSKLGLAGIRLGYLAARAEWVNEFNKVRQVYNVGVLTQIAAEFALEHLEVLEAQAATIRAERERLAGELAALAGVTVFPSRANFLLVRVRDAQRTYEGLRRQGVLVRSFHGAHPLMANCLRVTVGAPEENRILLNAMREAL